MNSSTSLGTGKPTMTSRGPAGVLEVTEIDVGGDVVVEGAPGAIRGDPRVRQAYLGNMITGGSA